MGILDVLAHRSPPNKAVRSFIDDLGGRVASEWEKLNCARRDFPAIAESELRRRPAHREIDYTRIVDSVVLDDGMPFQQNCDSHFGEPPVTLFWHSGFYIEALFWTTATPAVHNHSFAGAFSVLSGSSVQTIYGFAGAEVINEQLRLGHISVEQAHVLQQGDVQQILPREEFIHSVFHLDVPSVTIVVRTHSDPNLDGRFEYLRPHVAFDPTLENQQRTRRLQCLGLLAQIRSERYRSLARELIEKSDIVTGFLVLRQAWSLPLPQAALDELAGLARTTWGPRAGMLLAALDQSRLQSQSVQLRRRVVEPQLRLILGLLLTQADKQDIRQLVRSYAPGSDAGVTITNWIGDLAGLGVIAVTWDDLARQLLLLALGHEKGAHELNVDSFVATICTAQPTLTRQQIHTKWQELQSVPLLRPIL